MRRSLLVIVAVAALSGWISHMERAAGVDGPGDDWVRTVDGWERRASLTLPSPQRLPEVHPGLVACLQLAGSLAVLAAFPGRAAPAAVQPAEAAPRRRRARRSQVVGA
ncbi:MAG TPA: lipoprotein [Lacipirellulaceae bacterium]|nr:lipoprotein [Lacipirellulaceae bacterium]